MDRASTKRAKSRRAANVSETSDGRVGVPSPDRLKHVFLSVGEYLRQGQSKRAEEELRDAIDRYEHQPDDLAGLKRCFAFALETVGCYKESLAVIKPYEDEEVLSRLSIETRVRGVTQLGICYNNVNDHPKAVTLLKDNLEKAKEHGLRNLLGPIDSALARVYRKLNECPICRDYAEKAMTRFRETGDWLGMAEAYREMALSYHQEGNSEKSIEYFELGIQIIGDRSAPFMLGKIYTELSGAYWFLRKPQEGVACLEKSIKFFDQTEHVLNSVIAYNNLGINLMLIGEWNKAEKMINRALEIGLKENYVHVAGIYDSLGELKILRNELAEAEELLGTAVAFAEKHKHIWYTVQSMRNLARCYLARNEFEKAIAKSRETIDMAVEAGGKHYANMAGLV